MVYKVARGNADIVLSQIGSVVPVLWKDSAFVSSSRFEQHNRTVGDRDPVFAQRDKFRG